MNNTLLILVKGDLRGIFKALLLNRHTIKNIHHSLFFAFIYNFLAVSVVTGILYFWLGLLLSLMIAGVTMSIASVSLIANALRLKKSLKYGIEQSLSI